MPVDRLQQTLAADLTALAGRRKGDEAVVVGVVPPRDGHGHRFLLAGHGERPFLRLNSNAYLGLAFDPAVVAAEEEAVRRYGAGPGAVRFISGTYDVHRRLEERLAAFHGREAGMIFSSAYATALGVLVPLLSADTAVVSDALNHNCIINAIRLARPLAKAVYRHLDLGDLASQLGALPGTCRRAVVVTDGIFSMRGDHAPLAELAVVVRRHDAAFAENALLVVDDSHGVGAFGATGRGTEEHSGVVGAADLLIATLGKALGVNGGYVVGSRGVLDYLKETAPLYIYSNPITPGEAAAALAALEILDSPRGAALLVHLRAMTRRFEQGLLALGFETIPGEHPVTPLMVRDTERTSALVAHLQANGILATGLNYPVVPQGDQCIRFQLSADHTEKDVDTVLEALGRFRA